MPDQIIRKSDLARELGVSRARVSQLVGRGVPVRPDGRLDRARALAWVRANNFSWLGGWAVRQKSGARRESSSTASIPELDEMEREIMRSQLLLSRDPSEEDWSELEGGIPQAGNSPRFRR
jgi:hypothetical protein